MFRAASRWFMSALIVSAGSLAIVTSWNPGFSLRDVVLILVLPVIYAFYAAPYIVTACVLACILYFAARRIQPLRDCCYGVFAVVTGICSGVVVIMVGYPNMVPAFICIAAVAGGTGGLFSVSSVPMFSGRGVMTLAVGVLLSTVVALGSQRLTFPRHG